MDGRGIHVGIILKREKRASYMLFVTSNPNWGMRQITCDELALLGFPIKRTSYFTLVRRPNRNVRQTNITFPDYRLTELVEEFLDARV